jgi:hypothetical protein
MSDAEDYAAAECHLHELRRHLDAITLRSPGGDSSLGAVFGRVLLESGGQVDNARRRAVLDRALCPPVVMIGDPSRPDHRRRLEELAALHGVDGQVVMMPPETYAGGQWRGIDIGMVDLTRVDIAPEAVALFAEGLDDDT